jgi:transposase
MSHKPNESFVCEQQRKQYVSVVYCCVGGNLSDENLEQRISIKFCVQFGKSVSETLALLTVAYGEYVVKKSSVSEWQRRFMEGQEDLQDNPRSGQPQTQRTEEMCTEYEPCCSHIED